MRLTGEYIFMQTDLSIHINKFLQVKNSFIGEWKFK